MYLASRRCIHTTTPYHLSPYWIIILSSYHHHERRSGESTCFSFSFALLIDYLTHSKLLATRRGQIDVSYGATAMFANGKLPPKAAKTSPHISGKTIDEIKTSACLQLHNEDEEPQAPFNVAGESPLEHVGQALLEVLEELPLNLQLSLLNLEHQIHLKIFRDVLHHLRTSCLIYSCISLTYKCFCKVLYGCRQRDSRTVISSGSIIPAVSLTPRN